MNKLIRKFNTYVHAYKNWSEGLDLYIEYKLSKQKIDIEINEKLLRAFRDCAIQRFKYCTDLFWKLLKLYMQEIDKVESPSPAPRAVIREAARVRLISEEQATAFTQMVEDRNKTSHIYHQETAELIAENIPFYFTQISQVLTKLKENVNRVDTN